MPALQPVDHVFKTRHFGTVGGRNWAIILHYRWTGTPPTREVMQSFAQEMRDDFIAFALPAMHSTRTYVGTQTVDLTSPMGFKGFTENPTPGSEAGSELPASVCFMSSYPVDRQYRGGHPRNYWPFGVQADLLDPQHWTTAALAVFEPAASQVIYNRVGSTTDGCTIQSFCQVSYFHGEDEATEKPIPRIPPIVDDIQTNLFVGSVRIRSQRKRLGRGA